MNTSKLTVVFLAVLIATLIIWVTFFEHEKSIILKSGDEFTIEGKIASVDYMNTTYGTFPIVYLDSIIDILEDANILDDGIYNSLSHESLPDILGIFGNLDEEYHAGDNFKTTLHFKFLPRIDDGYRICDRWIIMFVHNWSHTNIRR